MIAPAPAAYASARARCAAVRHHGWRQNRESTPWVEASSEIISVDGDMALRDCRLRPRAMISPAQAAFSPAGAGCSAGHHHGWRQNRKSTPWLEAKSEFVFNVGAQAPPWDWRARPLRGKGALWLTRRVARATADGFPLSSQGPQRPISPNRNPRPGVTTRTASAVLQRLVFCRPAGGTTAAGSNYVNPANPPLRVVQGVKPGGLAKLEPCWRPGLMTCGTRSKPIGEPGAFGRPRWSSGRRCGRCKRRGDRKSVV